MNPSDIERIEIIRGAAAAALYGSRANNGVVQIFTKRGSVGKPRFTLTSRVAQSELREQQPFNLYPFNENGLPIGALQLPERHFPQRAGDRAEPDRRGRQRSDPLLRERQFLERRRHPAFDVVAAQRRARQPPAAAHAEADRQRHGELHHDEQPGPGVRRAERLRHHGIAVLRADERRFPAGERHLSRCPRRSARTRCLAIDRIRNPQTIDRFIGSTKLTLTPVTNLLLDYTIGIDNASFEQRQFVPRNAVLGTAPLATGRSQSVFQSTRVVNQDGVGTYTWKPMGALRAADDRRRQLHVAARSNDAGGRERPRAGRRSRERRLGVLRRADSTSSCARSASTASRSSAGDDRLFLTGAVRYDASSTFAPSERWQAFPKFSASYVADRQSPGNAQQPPCCAARSDGREASRAFSTRTRSSSATRSCRSPAVRASSTTSRSATRLCATSARASGKSARRSDSSADAPALEATYYNRLVSDLLFFRPLPTSTGFSRQFYPDRLDVEQGHRAAAEHDERRAHELRLDVDGRRTRTTRTSSRVSTSKISNRPADIRTAFAPGQPAGVFYGSYAARNCVTGALLLDSLGRYRRSNQTVDMGATLAQRQAISGGNCNDSLNTVIGDPNPNWMGSFLNEFTIAQEASPPRRCSTACSATRS